jgi:hypothetical protein
MLPQVLILERVLTSRMAWLQLQRACHPSLLMHLCSYMPRCAFVDVKARGGC